MKTYFTFAFLFGTCFSFAQSISGTLIDKKTNETIPFATVQIGEDYGVVTNQEGDFNINIANFQPTDSLVFSFMGYDRKAIAIKDFEDGKVYLEKNVEQLDEVLLMNRELTAMEVMEKVNEKLEENYGDSLMHFTVFRRNKNSMTPGEIFFDVKKARNMLDKKTLKSFNESIDSISKASRGYTTTGYNAFLANAVLGEKDSIKVQVEKATTLINKEKNISMGDFAIKVMETLAKKLKTPNTFKVRTGIIGIGDSVDVSKGFGDEKDTIQVDSLTPKSARYGLKTVLKESKFKKDKSISISIGGFAEGKIPEDFIFELKDYEYKHEGISSFNGEFVFVISFLPDRGLLGNQGKYMGTLYISTDTFAILKMDYRLAEGEHGTKLNLKFLLGVKFVESQKSGTIIYHQNQSGKYMPKYVRTSGQRYAYFNRNFVLKENDENRKDRMKLKFEFILEFDNSYQDEWLFVNSESITEDEFSSFMENEGVVDEHIEQYNPEIWKDYNILAPTEAIKQYEY